ncbi:Transglutaminase-like superfamily protein [Zunongwangia mangrovi]|uniref:Transglutaminase-like superfamily protein n=1 Tax=Zunongwangia mangrovi TaxID=1334022 RepID=A0A1I1EZZ1_9FLAO|nr:DUF3857 domain-containing protein [Zunongwangia mangrovi]SFB92212.1 Transglutaminase-like superfamily protein [Zunongwangia mangrovi]
MRLKFYLIAFLLVGGAMQAQNYKFGKVSKEEVEETEHPTNKDADAAILYKKQYSFYDYNSTTGLSLVTRYHYRIKLYNEDGFDWATVQLDEYKSSNDEEKIYGVKGYTYNILDGKLVDEKLRKDEIFDEEISKYRDAIKFTMPSLQAGSVVEYEYEKRSPFLTSLDDTELQATIPIKMMEVKVEIPEFFGFVSHYNQLASLFIPIDKTSEPFNMHTQNNDYLQTVYTITKENIPALKEEVYVDYLYNYAARIKWELQYTKFPNQPMDYFSHSWEDVSKSIYDDGGYATELRRSNFFKDDVDAILDGASSAEEKLVRIYNFIKSKVAWNDYIGYTAENGIKKAYKEGSGNTGDINLLLIAMLRYAGLESHPVLLSTKSNGVPVFPTRSGFNYVIAGVQFGEQTLLLDATDKNAAPGELPERARNWQGRIIKDEGKSDWVYLLPTYKSKELNYMNLQITEDLKLKGKYTGIYEKLVAKNFRDKYKGINEESYLELLQEGKGDILISELTKENEDAIGQNVKEVYQFEINNGVEAIGDKLYVNPLLFLSEKENPFKAEERTYPIYLNYPVEYASTINFMIPKGYKIESLPESAMVNMNEEDAKFKYLITQSSNFLRLETSIDLNKSVFSANDYEHLKNFFDEIVSKHSEAIVLSKIEEDNGSTELTEGRR